MARASSLVLAGLFFASSVMAQADAPPLLSGAAVTPSDAVNDVAPDSVFRHRAVMAYVERGPERSLSWELVVPATAEEVWRAWTTAEGIASWSAPAGYVELRKGGSWEAHFNPDRPPGERGSDANEIVDFVPGRMLVIRAGAPQQFPNVRREKTTFTLLLTPVARDHTLVQGTQTGWKEGAEWDAAFEYLGRANAVWLDWLHQRFTTGPIDWSEGPAS